jgi:hypothetical protein
MKAGSHAAFYGWKAQHLLAATVGADRNPSPLFVCDCAKRPNRPDQACERKKRTPDVQHVCEYMVGTGRKEAMAIPTDEGGVARLYLTDKDAEVNVQIDQKCGLFGVGHPVVKYADTIRILAGYVVCQPYAPDYCWLAGMEFSTNHILQQGIAAANTCGKATASPERGDLIIFVRPLTWWEKLKQ